MSPSQYVLSPIQYIKREKWVDVFSVSWQKKLFVSFVLILG